MHGLHRHIGTKGEGNVTMYSVRELMTHDSLDYAKSPALDTPLVSGVPNWHPSSIFSSLVALLL